MKYNKISERGKKEMNALGHFLQRAAGCLFLLE